jgi:hypothetical protein
MMHHTRRTACALLAAAVSLAGCASSPDQGYSFGSTFSRDVQTVEVPIFKNSTFSRGIEVELTDAIIKEIHATTPWRVVAGGDGGQATLEGTIAATELQKLSTARTSGLAQEVAVRMSVDFTFRDNRSGRILVSRQSFTASESFVPSKNLGEPLEVGQYSVVQELARDIVAELRSTW